MITKWIAAAGLALAVALAPQAAKPAANDDLTIECPDQGLSMTALVAMAREVTGEPFFYDERELKDVKLVFLGKMVVPRARFMSFFEYCARTVDFVPFESTQAGVRIHQLVRLGGNSSGRAATALKTRARIVELTELPQLADRWTLVTTTYTCKNLPARELVTTMQLYFADSATEAIRNIEGTNMMVMTGFAANIAAIVRMCERIDTEAATTATFQAARELEKRLAALEEKVAALAPKAK